MCGIFGVIANSDNKHSSAFLRNSLLYLAKLSESRGKDSSGLCVNNKNIEVYKGPLPIHKLLEDNRVKQSVNDSFKREGAKWAFGHARLVTNGTQLNDENNQPVVRDGCVAVHNGIVVNVDALWAENPDLQRKNEIDTEVIPALVKKFQTQGLAVEEASSLAIRSVFGTVATAMAFDDLSKFILATNNGSLYTLSNNEDFLVFASEHFMLERYLRKFGTGNNFGDIQQLEPGTGLSIELDSFQINRFSFNDKFEKRNEKGNSERKKIKVFPVAAAKPQRSTVMDLNYIHLNPEADKEKALLDYPINKIKQLKRCTKCLLPETFPYIHFDETGECNYCKSYKKKNQLKPISELLDLVEPYRKLDKKPEILVPFSGGRDSTFVLHTVCEELGLKAVAYTYDWGMVTDLARRNVARICGKLGVENIIVAADIHWKRENIRKNITAWLKKPELGMIPLFMAGDKFFFYYAHKIKKQLGIDLEIWGVNELENTNFKTGFAGLKPEFDKKRIYSLSIQNKLKLFSFVGKNVMQSPGYINQSILDSLGSFASRYFTPKADYYHLFDYMTWDEKLIEKTIIDNYNWETSVDTNSTWRIGDGTASFYNYIYTRVAGFSENDTFRSNQIREGMISREEGLKLIYEENKPRYNSLKWYLEIIGMDFESTIKRINEIQPIF